MANVRTIKHCNHSRAFPQPRNWAKISLFWSDHTAELQKIVWSNLQVFNANIERHRRPPKVKKAINPHLWSGQVDPLGGQQVQEVFLLQVDHLGGQQGDERKRLGLILHQLKIQLNQNGSDPFQPEQPIPKSKPNQTAYSLSRIIPGCLLQSFSESSQRPLRKYEVSEIVHVWPMSVCPLPVLPKSVHGSKLYVDWVWDWISEC